MPQAKRRSRDALARARVLQVDSLATEVRSQRFSSSWPLPPSVATSLDRLGYNAAFEAATARPADANGGGVLSQLSDGVLSRPSQMQESLSMALLQLENPQLYG